MRTRRRWWMAALLLSGCGSNALLAEGQPCSSSPECGAGLLCDFVRTPHVCGRTQGIVQDMAVPAGDGGLRDLAGLDLTGLDLGTKD